MTGTERLHGPALQSAHKLHQQMKERTGLNCSIGIGSSRLMAKISSDKAKPNGVLYVLPGQEQSFLAPLDVGKIPGVGKVTKARLNQIGIRQIGDLLKVEERVLEENFGKWGADLRGKARGEDAGAWFEGEVGEEWDAKSISHEHTYDEDTDSVEQIEATLMRLCEMVARRLRESRLHARTLQLKLRYQDFTTITRAHTIAVPTQLDNEIFRHIRRLFHANWRQGAEVRLLGVQASSFSELPSQQGLLEPLAHEKWKQALSTVDRLRDKFGESSVTLGTGMKGSFRERTHENPAALPGKSKAGGS
jgi:DNA polymerase-4